MKDTLIQNEDFENKNTEKTDDIVKNKENFNKKENHSKKTIIKIGAILGIILLIVLGFSTIFALINMSNSNIVSGVKIQGIDISGLSKDEAISKINLIYDEKKSKDITLKYEEYEATINPELIEANYDIENAINEAISVGKDSNIFINNYNILFALIGKKDINVNLTINEEITKQTIEDISKNIPGAVEESDYYIEEDNLIITKGKDGLKIDSDLLIERIVEALEDINFKQEYIEIPVINKSPEKIDIDKIHEEIYKEVQDAYYTSDPFTIYPEVEGVDFDIDEAKSMLLSEEEEQYTIKLTITKPKITTAQIGSEAFPDLLATYTTRYDATNTDRTTNLRIACQKINDTVVLPGETFSYNQPLGERTVAAGYKNAKVYENGEVVDGIGGGICQISSTLYNSVLMSNLEIIERRNHQFVTSYTPPGRDATVVYGMTDFKFKNTRDYAIKIKASISNGIATVSIYGIKSENEYEVSFSTKTISTIPYTVKYIEDNTIPVGTENVKQVGANGAITETYIIKSLNGVVVSRELLSKDTYSAMQRIIVKGTKGSTSTTNTYSSNANTSTVTTSTQTQESTEITTPNNEENNNQQETTETVETPKDSKIDTETTESASE
jgi:vancomycin resistance protein YoaR